MKTFNGQIWQRANELVNRIPTEKGLHLFVSSIFQDLHFDDLYKSAEILLELADKIRKEEEQSA